MIITDWEELPKIKDTLILEGSHYLKLDLDSEEQSEEEPKKQFKPLYYLKWIFPENKAAYLKPYILSANLPPTEPDPIPGKKYKLGIADIKITNEKTNKGKGKWFIIKAKVGILEEINE